jgi:hypothetical protein
MVPHAWSQVGLHPQGGVPPPQYVESSLASSDARSSPSIDLTPTLHALPLLAQTHDMNHSEQANGILDYVRQLSDTRNELSDNSNEPYVRLERFHGLVHGEPRELLA